jgi:hypothetical protein
LLGASVEELFEEVETMQQRGGAYKDEIAALFREAGVSDIACYETGDPQDVYHSIMSLPNGESVGLVYYRLGGTSHMVVATRDDGYVSNFVNQGIKCVDYQQSPPMVAGFPPEMTIVRYAIFYRS